MIFWNTWRWQYFTSDVHVGSPACPRFPNKKISVWIFTCLLQQRGGSSPCGAVLHLFHNLTGRILSPSRSLWVCLAPSSATQVARGFRPYRRQSFSYTVVPLDYFYHLLQKKFQRDALYPCRYYWTLSF